MNLVDLFPEESMILNLEARDKKSAIREMLQRLVERGHLDEETVKKAEKAVLKREGQASTGIGKWLGVPHAKGCGFLGSDLVGVYARATEGLSYESVDGEPVHVLFLVLSTDAGADEHLAVMRRVAALHRDEKSAKYLTQSTNSGSIREIFKEVDEQFS